MKKLTEKTLRKLVCDIGLPIDEAHSMSRGEIFEAWLNYEGYIHCAHEIKTIVQEVYGIDLNNWKEYLNPESVAEMEGLEEY